MMYCSNVISTCGRPHVRVKSCVFWDAVCNCAAVPVSVIRVDESASCVGGCGDYRYRLGLRLDPYSGCEGGCTKLIRRAGKLFRLTPSLPLVWPEPYPSLFCVCVIVHMVVCS
jgi:hypothetical protein